MSIFDLFKKPADNDVANGRKPAPGAANEDSRTREIRENAQADAVREAEERRRRNGGY